MTNIGASVGRDGVNRVEDVRQVQQWLLAQGFPIGNIDGTCGQRTIGALIAFGVADGCIAPGNELLPRLSQPPPLPGVSANQLGSLTRLVPRPARETINHGLSPVDNQLMTQLLGSPREDYGEDCQPVTQPRLRRNISTGTVGPFKATGLTPAVASLQQVMTAIAAQQPEVAAILSSAGMLCCRWVRGSTTSISNHSWGTAIDLKLNNILDVRNDNQVQIGLTLIAPIFNQFGWYWGAAFRTEDAMHFEAGRALVEGWAAQLS
jgi:peptidoglycan hydrolase-like protein with peptidoglycan-binding domain